MDPKDQLPISALPAHARKMLIQLDLRFKYAAEFSNTMTDREVDEISELVSTLSKAERQFVSKLFSYGISALNSLYKNKLSAVVGDVLVACHVAPIFLTSAAADYEPAAAYSYTASVSNSLKYAMRFPAEALDWKNKEVVTHARGIAMTISAGCLQSTSYESVRWIGENYVKLIPFLSMMGTVSSERDYLELLLANDATALQNGVL